MPIRKVVAAREAAVVIVQPGQLKQTVPTINAVNMPAQISSGLREIRNTLQKRKKWQTTKRMKNPSHGR